MKRIQFALLVILAGMLSWPAAQAEPLHIDYMVSSGPQRSTWVDLLQRFATENPDITLVNREFAQETYKKGFLKRLETEQVDIAFWFAGQRLREAVQRKLLAPMDQEQVDGLLKKNFMPFSYEASSIGGRVYGLPISYYPWGFFYNKSVFARLGLRPPTNWSEFVDVCDKLKAAGIAPLAIGAKDGWPAAGWFDYLNLRINGIEFHRRLLQGKESFRDARVRRVFDEWRALLVKGYFNADLVGQEWDRVLPYLYRQKVGMTLMGSFAAAKFPPEVAADIGFFSFPRIAPEMPVYEEAPLDVLVLPARAKHHAARRRFVAFLAQSDVLEQLNASRNTISPRSGAASAPGLMAPLDAAAGVTFFFDRDAKAGIVPAAIEGFRRFLLPPHDVEAALRHIDKHARP